MGASGLDPSDIPTQTSTQQNLMNGTSESVSVESNSVASTTIQRHQQLSQLLQTKPNVAHSIIPTSSSHSGISATQRIPSPNVSLASITAVKSPHANNLTSSNITLHKPGTPVSSSAHISVADGSSSITNISNSIVNSLSNTSGTLGMNSNMLLMQSKVNTICSQGNPVSLPTSVAGSVSSVQHHSLIPTIQSQQVNQQTNASLINGSHIPLGSSSSISINRGGNSSVSSTASHSTVISPHSSHHNILEYHSLNTQGATLKVRLFICSTTFLELCWLLHFNNFLYL